MVLSVDLAAVIAALNQTLAIVVDVANSWKESATKEKTMRKITLLNETLTNVEQAHRKLKQLEDEKPEAISKEMAMAVESLEQVLKGLKANAKARSTRPDLLAEDFLADKCNRANGLADGIKAVCNYELKKLVSNPVHKDIFSRY